MGANASTPTAPAPEAAASCPVDHKTRDAWLRQNPGGAPPHPMPPSAVPADPSSSSLSAPSQPSKNHRRLSQDREISTIPRAFPNSSPSKSESVESQACPHAASHGTPSNAEAETGHDERSGNWVYPSERQFFEALMRKNTPTSASSPTELATSVASIIPIHNAVNERAWAEILDWESKSPAADPGSKRCGGPKLYAFRGLGVESQFLSPRARINGWLGYQRPFDRHDWVVERCGGERIEYVIDFYQGRSGGAGNNGGLTGASGPGKLSFYLDVRPKLNTWEGWRMRAASVVGL